MPLDIFVELLAIVRMLVEIELRLREHSHTRE